MNRLYIRPDSGRKIHELARPFCKRAVRHSGNSALHARLPPRKVIAFRSNIQPEEASVFRHCRKHLRTVYAIITKMLKMKMCVAVHKNYFAVTARSVITYSPA